MRRTDFEYKSGFATLISSNKLTEDAVHTIKDIERFDRLFDIFETETIVFHLKNLKRLLAKILKLNFFIKHYNF